MATIAGAIISLTGGYIVAHGTITTDAQAWSSTATWNAAGVTFTHLKANVTDTASAAASLLIDLQVGGTSQFKVSKAGLGTFAGGVTCAALIATSGTFSSTVLVGSANTLGWTSRSGMVSPSDGVITLYNNAGNDFGRVQFGGTTSSFPAIKRVSATVACRLADDSADADFTAAGFSARSTLVAVVTGIHFKYGVTAATAVAVASTHKIEVRDTAGTTYYLLATT